MSKPVLYYFDGRGRAIWVRWMLAANNIEYDEVFVKNKSQYKKMVEDGLLLFQQVPVLEIDGIRLCQIRAIIRYLARKASMCGTISIQQAQIDMYMEGAIDMYDTFLLLMPFQTEDNKESFYQENKKKLLQRYFPAFEKALNESKTSYLADSENLSLADVMLIAGLDVYTEFEQDILENFPKLKGWFQEQKKTPWIGRFLGPGSKRKPYPDQVYVSTVAATIFT